MESQREYISLLTVCFMFKKTNMKVLQGRGLAEELQDIDS